MLTDDQITGIRELCGCGFSSRTVAAKFGCSHVAVCRVWKGTTLTTQERLEKKRERFEKKGGGLEKKREGLEKCFWSKVKKADPNDCWEWLAALNKGGYGQCFLCGTQHSAHRIAVMLDGRDPAGKVVRHSCDNPKCVNPRHLVLGTHADNVADRVARKRTAVGTRNGRSKLNPLKVRAIRKSKRVITELARHYGVDPKVIRDVKARKTWKHII
jgi:hypothetical protein